MSRKYFVFFVLLAVSCIAKAQSLNEFLHGVAANNPEITAYSKLLVARKYEARTGNAPADPFISAGIMPGTPDAAGTKKVWSVTQSFDFPSKYLLQKKINTSTIQLAEQEYRLGVLQIMLYAKDSWLDLAWKMKYLTALQSRKSVYDNLQSAWKKMLDNGQTTILDYNRIMMEISAVNLAITRTQSDIAMLGERLSYLIGGGAASPPGDYPLAAEPDAEALLKEKVAVHPSWLIPEMEYNISVQEVKLSKSQGLPGLELGVSSEIVPGETYTGPVGGISLPLWSNSNRVKAASARSQHLSARRDALILRLNSEVRTEFSNMKAIQKSITDVTEILNTGEGTKYLNSALEAGQISITTYFTYLEAIYQTQDRLLSLENEYQKSLAKLLDHDLLTFQ